MPTTYYINLGFIGFQVHSFSQWIFIVLCILTLLYAAYLLNQLKTGRKLLIILQIIFYSFLTLFFLLLFPPVTIFIIILKIIPLFEMLNYGNALAYYAAKGNVKALKTLILKRHQNFHETTTSYGWTPLFYAVDNDKEEAVNFLLNVGAYVNVLDNNGHTPLYYAKTERIKQLLISFGAKDEEELKNISSKG